MIGPDDRKTSQYYWDSAKYWLDLMKVDVRSRDIRQLKQHYKNFGEALGISLRARKKGD
ncbi:hypothetical protein [Limosilactobacillus reuteri]|uniref:hypothetical protein n=1 Tax=Limosilactobacillus reuteri TaxID=1598 RepID=UPI001E4D85D2|nr:hypothetical protein [Limosilactobacillus reuteri]MCC4361948.1 hypothetical protein [Limosilactobacillus reuteri]MCC4363768.1 hypothetical protein [Limosilactobacillus reuteri]